MQNLDWNNIETNEKKEKVGQSLIFNKFIYHDQDKSDRCSQWVINFKNGIKGDLNTNIKKLKCQTIQKLPHI